MEVRPVHCESKLRRLPVMRCVLSGFVVLTASFLPISAVTAAETTVYRYDAKGRLVKVIKSGSVNNGVVTEYRHDRADNRRKRKTTGAP
jgi:hypothetical protein